MAQVIQEETRPQAISQSYVWWKVCVTGAGIGVLWWLLTFLIDHFVVDPLLCKSAIDANTCSNSIELSGNIATILASVVGLGLLIRQRVLRPIVVALASAITLWGLAVWVDDLVYGEALLWGAFLYGLTYMLYSWVSRYTLSVPVMLAAAGIIVIARIAVAL
jgi:hypothetical protein